MLAATIRASNIVVNSEYSARRTSEPADVHAFMHDNNYKVNKWSK